MTKSFEEIIDDVIKVAEDKLMGVLEEYDPVFRTEVNDPKVQTLVIAMAQEIGSSFEKLADRIKDYGERIKSGNV